MKVTAPTDLHGRLISVETRLTMLQQSFEALASAYDAVGAPSAETLQGFADVADELVDEVVSIQEAYVEESNADDAVPRTPAERRLLAEHRGISEARRIPDGRLLAMYRDASPERKGYLMRAVVQAAGLEPLRRPPA